MVIVRLKPTDKAQRFFERENIDRNILETILNFYARYIDLRKRTHVIKVILDIDCRKYDSEYSFNSYHISIAGPSKGEPKTNSRKARLKYVIDNLMHEFRHFVQDFVFHHDISDVDYYDGDELSDSYENHPLEIDANWFEQRASKKALELYYQLKKAKIRDINEYQG
jgi:hypothetical protein